MHRLAGLFAVVLAVVVLVLPAGVGVSYGQEAILVGVNMELTGYSSDQGTEQYRGIMAAHRLQPTVDAGGATYPIELIVCDNQTQREEAANCATRLVGQGVVAVLGGFSSAMSNAASPIMQDAGVVQIATGATNPVVTQLGDFIFRIPFTDDAQGQVLASYAYETLGARRVVVFRQADDDASVGLTRVFSEAFEGYGGQVLVQSFNQAAVDFSAQLNNARRFNPDVMMTTAYCPTAGPLVRQARAAGFQQQWIGGDSLDSPVCVELGGTAFEGVQFTGFPDLGQLEPDALERAEPVRQSYFELYPDSIGFGGVSLAGSDGYGVLREAVARALAAGVSPSGLPAFRQAVRDQLAAMVDYPGVTGYITYVGTDGTPASRSMGLMAVEGVREGGRYDRVGKGYFVLEPGQVVYYPAN